MQECFTGGVGDKRSGKTLETSGHPQFFSKKMHRWEDAMASSFGNEGGDGHPSHVKHQRDGWIWLRTDSCGQLS